MKLEQFEMQLKHLREQTATMERTLADVRQSLSLFDPLRDPPARAQAVKHHLQKILGDIQDDYCGAVVRWCDEWIAGIADARRRMN